MGRQPGKGGPTRLLIYAAEKLVPMILVGDVRELTGKNLAYIIIYGD